MTSLYSCCIYWPVYDVDDNVGGGEDDPGDPVYLAHWVESLLWVTDVSGNTALTRTVLCAFICHLEQSKEDPGWNTNISLVLLSPETPDWVVCPEWIFPYLVCGWRQCWQTGMLSCEMFIWLPERLTSVWWFMPGRQGRKEILPELRPFPFLNKPAICYPGLLSGHTWTFCSVQRTSWRRGGGSGSCSPGCAGCGWSRCWWRCSGGRSPGWRSPSPAWLSYGTGPGVKCQYFPLTETVYCDCDPSKTNIGRFLLVLASVWLVTGERRLMAATQYLVRQ